MFRKAFFSASILAVHVLAKDDPAIPADQAPSQFCGVIENVHNYSRTPEQYYGSVMPPESVRISAGVICSSENATDQGCAVQAGGFLELSNTYNFSGKFELEPRGSEPRSIDWTIYNQTGDYSLYFAHPAFGAVPNDTIYFEPDLSQTARNDTYVDNGTASEPTSAVYATFRALYQCVSGRYSNCPEGLGIHNGTYIEACYPQYVTGADRIEGARVFRGTPDLELTNVTYAASLQDNPHENLPQGLVLSGAISEKSGGAMAALMVATAALTVLVM